MSPRESLFRYSPAFVLIAIAILDSSRYADPDLYGHLYFGQQILLTGHVARVDPYSYSVRGLPWVSHEWLSDALIAWFYNLGGVVGLKLLKFGCSAAIVITLLLAMEEAGASAITQLAIIMFAGIRLSAQMQFRPQLFSYLLLSIALLMLARDNFRGNTRLWAIVPIFALWANLHGGFIVGLGAIGIYALVRGAQDVAIGNGRARLIHLSAIAGACAMATLLTPYGSASWISVLHTIGNPAMLRAINEWRPLLTATRAEYHVAHLPFFYDLSVFGIFFGLAIVLVLAPSADDLPLVAIAAVLIAAAFAQVRNVPLGMIAAIPPLAYHAALALEARRHAPDVVAPPRRQGLVGQTVVVIVALALSAETGLFSRRLGLSEQYPAGALAFMRSKGLFGNVLCEYSWSDYIIFHDASRDRVFIDSRFEMIYPRRIIEAYLDFLNGRADAARTLADFPNDYVLIDPKTPAESVMAHAGGWARIYSDRYSILYAPRGSRAAGLAGIPVRGRTVSAAFP